MNLNNTTHSCYDRETDSFRQCIIGHKPGHVGHSPHETRHYARENSSVVNAWFVAHDHAVYDEISCAGQKYSTEMGKHVVETCRKKQSKLLITYLINHFCYETLI